MVSYSTMWRPGYTSTHLSAEVEVATLSDNLRDVEADALVQMLANTPAKVGSESPGDIVVNVVTEPSIGTPPLTLAKAEGYTLGNTQGYLKVEAPVYSLHHIRGTR